MKNFLKSFFDIKLWKFILVGVLNTIVGTGLQFVFYNLTFLNNMNEPGVIIASSVSYILASVMSYFLNKYFTFKNKDMNEPGVIIASSVGYVLASVMSDFLNKYLPFKNKEKGINPILRFALNIAVCYALAYGLAVPFVNFICKANGIEMFGLTVESFAANLSMIAGSCLFVAFNYFDIKLWKFILVGVLNTIVGTGLQFVFYNLTFLNDMNEPGVIIASSVSYILASVMSYFLNKYFTFKNKEKGIKPILRFALNIAVCYALAYGLAVPFVNFICKANGIEMFGLTVESFAANLSMIAGSCLFVAFNYIGQRFFAFKER